MVLALDVVPFFTTWYVSSTVALKAFHAFACGGSSYLLASLLPLLAWMLEVDPSVSSIWVFLGLWILITLWWEVQIIFICFWIILFETYSSLLPKHLFLLFPCGVLSSPFGATSLNTKKLGPTLMVFVWRLKKSLGKAFSLGANTGYIVIFRPRSFDAHAHFEFFFCPTLSQRLKRSLVLRYVGEYACVTLNP